MAFEMIEYKPGDTLSAEHLNQMQIALKDAQLGGVVESTENPGCYYRMVDGEKEWLNPPLYYNTEYRTTERWYGKPVYTKHLHFSVVEPGIKHTFEISNEQYIRVKAFARNSTTGWQIPLPFFDFGFDHSLSMYAQVFKDSLQCYIADTSSNYSVNVQLFYFK